MPAAILLLDAALLFGLFSPLNGRKIYSNLFLLFYGEEFLPVILQVLFYGEEFLPVILQICNHIIVSGYGPCFQAILKPNQSTLELFDILTPQNRDMVFVHPELLAFLLALTDLYNADLLKDNILKQENFDKLFGHPFLCQVSSALNVLFRADVSNADSPKVNILTQENFDKLIKVIDENNLCQVSSALSVLLEAKLLSPENFDKLIEHQTPAVFAAECIRANSLDDEVIATFSL